MSIDSSTTIEGPVDTTVEAIVDAVYRRGGERVAYDLAEVQQIADAIVDLAEIYGLRPSLIAAQIIHETGGFTYGNQVAADQWNFAGIGATDDGAAGHGFASIEEGVEAVLQHHYAYLGKKIPEGATLLDPRFDLVSKRVSTIGEYGNGVWATGKGYADAIVKIANELVIPATGETVMSVMSLVGERCEAQGIEVHDLRQSLPRSQTEDYPRTTLQALRYTAIHYTAAHNTVASLTEDVGGWMSHAAYHVNTHGWPGIAYCLGVSLSGRLFLLHEFEEAGYHAYGANFNAIGIAVDMGQQDPTPQALTTLGHLLQVLHEATPELPYLTRATTYGHSELTFLSPHNLTMCPGRLLPSVQAYRTGATMPDDVSGSVTFPTGITMRTETGFYQYWAANGNVPVFGYPISDEMDENAVTVQYFERARLEMSATGEILRGLVGLEAYTAKYSAPYPATEETRGDDA